MKTFWCLAVAIVLAVDHINAREPCEDINNPPYNIDCAGKGEPQHYKNAYDSCVPGCKVGNEILSCEEVHPAPNSAEYEHETCKDKSQAYDCKGRGTPLWSHYDDQCTFGCLVGGDMLFTCDQIHYEAK